MGLKPPCYLLYRIFESQLLPCWQPGFQNEMGCIYFPTDRLVASAQTFSSLGSNGVKTRQQAKQVALILFASSSQNLTSWWGYMQSQGIIKLFTPPSLRAVIWISTTNFIQPWKWTSSSSATVSKLNFEESHGIINAVSIRYLRHTNGCTKLNADPSQIYWDISSRTKVVDSLTETFVPIICC